MPNEETVALLACPFCGGEAEVESQPCGYRGVCQNVECGTEGPWPTDCAAEEAITAWNTRAALAAMGRRDIASFQARVDGWMQQCFGPAIAADKLERNDRFIEEALELVQATGYSADRAHALVDYVFGRLVGDPSQEVGGVMVTLAALCNANGLDIPNAAETELARILSPAIIEKIRAKQAAKPTGSALPTPPEPTT